MITLGMPAPPGRSTDQTTPLSCPWPSKANPTVRRADLRSRTCTHPPTHPPTCTHVHTQTHPRTPGRTAPHLTAPHRTAPHRTQPCPSVSAAPPLPSIYKTLCCCCRRCCGCGCSYSTPRPWATRCLCCCTDSTRSHGQPHAGAAATGTQNALPLRPSP